MIFNFVVLSDYKNISTTEISGFTVLGALKLFWPQKILGRCCHQAGQAFARGISYIAVLILPVMYYPYWLIQSFSPTTLSYWRAIAWSSLNITHTHTQTKKPNIHKITKAEAAGLRNSLTGSQSGHGWTSLGSDWICWLSPDELQLSTIVPTHCGGLVTLVKCCPVAHIQTSTTELLLSLSHAISIHTS